VSEYLSGQSLEEVFTEELGGEYRSRHFAWRAIRSIVKDGHAIMAAITTQAMRGATMRTPLFSKTTR
jgi:hypothetical protein